MTGFGAKFDTIFFNTQSKLGSSQLEHSPRREINDHEPNAPRTHQRYSVTGE